jgi:hypothetical protein
MGTPYYQTDESAHDTVADYMEMQGLDCFEDALKDMNACYDDLDNEDRSALNYILNKRAKALEAGSNPL